MRWGCGTNQHLGAGVELQIFAALVNHRTCACACADDSTNSGAFATADDTADDCAEGGAAAGAYGRIFSAAFGFDIALFINGF